MLDWTADWLTRGMTSHGKPTRYEVRPLAAQAAILTHLKASEDRWIATE